MVFFDIRSGELCCKEPNQPAAAAMWMSGCQAVCLSVRLPARPGAQRRAKQVPRAPFPLSPSNVPPGAVNRAQHRTLTPQVMLDQGPRGPRWDFAVLSHGEALGLYICTSPST